MYSENNNRTGDTQVAGSTHGRSTSSDDYGKDVLP